MRRYIGPFLLIAGLTVLVYISTYEGNLMRFRALWFVLSLALLLLGSFLIVIQKIRNQFETKAGEHPLIHADLVKTGEPVKLSLQNCEVKSRSYKEGSYAEANDATMLDALYDPGRNYREAEITQTYIVYKAIRNGKLYKFVSPAIYQDALAVENQIEKGSIHLYINRKNPDQYYFEVEGM